MKAYLNSRSPGTKGAIQREGDGVDIPHPLQRLVRDSDSSEVSKRACRPRIRRQFPSAPSMGKIQKCLSGADARIQKARILCNSSTDKMPASASFVLFNGGISIIRRCHGQIAADHVLPPRALRLCRSDCRTLSALMLTEFGQRNGAFQNGLILVSGKCKLLLNES